MTQAVTVRRDGDTFQARLFWRHAARLLDPESPIIKVGFEQGPKSFDDIWVEYDPSKSAQDQYGEPLRRKHIQCKWHVCPDSYGYVHLVDPEFINANARSLLQRAREAQVGYAPDGVGVRFELLTNWRLDRADPLREMIGNRSGAVRLDRLYGSLTDKSRAGSVRKAWREHLAIDEDELRILARTLAFGEANDSLDGLRDDLDILFAYVGLRRVPCNQSAFPYDDLVFQWMAQGRLEFDRASLHAICNREGLIGQGEGRPRVYGVKSFEHSMDHLEERCLRVLDLVPAFDERYIRSETDWADTLYPALKTFLLSAAKGEPRLRLAIDAHVTLAFAAGSVLNMKSGRIVELEQRTTGRQVWSAEDAPADPSWPTLSAAVVETGSGGSDLAVAISLAHDVDDDVLRYLQRAQPAVGRLLSLRTTGAIGATSVVCGCHAFELAEAATRLVREKRGFDPAATLHLFVAAPNSFTFFLGQRQPVIGRVTLYEFDFEGGRDRSYAPALMLPTTVSSRACGTQLRRT
ncbi:SAVED domain-containing protein [Methylorubrum populi]